MTITLNIPDADAIQIVEGVCAATGWSEASGKTKAAWEKEKLVTWIKDTAKRGLLRSSQATINSAVDPISIT